MKREELKEGLSNYEGKISVMKAQNDRLNHILNSRTNQLENMKTKYLNLETGLNLINSIEKDKIIVEEKCKSL